MHARVRRHKLLTRYLSALVATAAGLAGLCLIVNLLVDPLWFLHGNVITGVNFAFNERVAKMNQFLPDLERYDCLIMGSSRATLLPARQIAGYHCFNLGFSGGRITEYLLYAQYLRARGFTPALLIVGIDPFNFIGPMPEPDVPDFIRTGTDPPSLLHSYLSLDALGLSIRELEGESPHHRYYDRELNGRILARAREFRPPSLVKPLPDTSGVHAERAALYTQLRQLFPTARAIGYVPPVSAWSIARLRVSGALDDYLTALGRVSAGYDEMLDFGIPSSITVSTDDTYDGSHYSEAVNARIAMALQNHQADPGVDWHRETPQAIAALYRERLDQLVSNLD
jgi:hypothetical protein